MASELQCVYDKLTLEFLCIHKCITNNTCVVWWQTLRKHIIATSRLNSSFYSWDQFMKTVNFSAYWNFKIQLQLTVSFSKSVSWLLDAASNNDRCTWSMRKRLFVGVTVRWQSERVISFHETLTYYVVTINSTNWNNNPNSLVSSIYHTTDQVFN